MPKGQWVGVYRSIQDPEKLETYNKLAPLAVGPAGGRTLIRGGRLVAYESAAYQKALAALADGVERDFRIVEGLD